MSPFTTVAQVDDALKHYCLRPSKTTGRQLSPATAQRLGYLMTHEAKRVFASGLRGNELMWALDRAFESEARTHRSLGLVMLSHFANYYGLLTDAEAKWWSAEGNKRYKPSKPVAERILQRDELKAYFDQFLTKTPDHFTAARLYCFSALLLLSGARRKAIVQLRMSDLRVTETELTLSLERLKSANTAPQIIHIPLDVPLPNGRPFGEALYAWLDARLPNDRLFMDTTNQHGSGLAMSIRHQMDKYAARAGLSHISPHMFRFTCASIISDHVGIKQAQQLLGHSELRTTMRYAGLAYDNVSRSSISNGFGQFATHVDG